MISRHFSPPPLLSFPIKGEVECGEDSAQFKVDKIAFMIIIDDWRING